MILYTIANTRFFTFDLELGLKVTQNVALYPLHHKTFTPANIAVATFNSLGGDAFTRK